MQGQLLLILPTHHAPYISHNNYNFVQQTMRRAQMSEILVSGFDPLIQRNGMLNVEWAQGLGCAALDRSVRSSTKVVWSAIAGLGGCTRRGCRLGGWSVTNLAACGLRDILEMSLKPGVSCAGCNATHPFWLD